jgi:hypothetical protein
MSIGRETTLRDLAFLVCTELDASGATAVLTGGSACTVYAPDAYQFRDFDFIFQFSAGIFPVADAPLKNLGFIMRGNVPPREGRSQNKAPILHRIMDQETSQSLLASLEVHRFMHLALPRLNASHLPIDLADEWLFSIPDCLYQLVRPRIPRIHEYRFPAMNAHRQSSSHRFILCTHFVVLT